MYQKIISMKYYKVTLVLLFAFVGCCFDMAAQDTNKTYNETVIVTSTFNPIVSEARKIDDKARTMDMMIDKDTFSLNPVDMPFHPVMPLETIKAAKVKGEPIEMLFNTHISAGIGTYLTPYLDVSHSQTRSRSFIYSIHARHYSSLDGTMDDVAHSTFADNNIEAFAKKIWNDFYISGNIYYDYNRYYYYGFNEKSLNLDIDKAKYRSAYNHVGFGLNYGSLYNNPDNLHNSAHFNMDYTNHINGISETDINFLANLHKNFRFWKGNPQIIGLDLAYKHRLFTNEFELTPYFIDVSLIPYTLFYDIYGNTDNGRLTIKPYFDFSIPQIKDLSLHAAVKFEPVFASEGGKFNVLPEIFAYYPLISKYLHLKAGINGDIRSKTLNEVRLENPYVSPSVLLLNERNINLFIQAFSKPLPSLTMQLDLALNFFSDKGFYDLDWQADLNNMFILDYDDGKQYSAKFQLNYNIDKRLNVIFNMQLQGFSLESLPAAYYQPVFSTALAVEYIVAKKLRLQFTPSFFTSSKARNHLNEIVSLSPRIDLNLAAQYDYNKQLSFFINLNNLAFQRQYRYINYPSQRFMGMIGAKIAF
jgi:hypothetical protein